MLCVSSAMHFNFDEENNVCLLMVNTQTFGSFALVDKINVYS
jgi:ubiquitin-protein ligase